MQIFPGHISPRTYGELNGKNRKDREPPGRISVAPAGYSKQNSTFVPGTSHADMATGVSEKTYKETDNYGKSFSDGCKQGNRLWNQ